jgi:hypothetical protein
MKVNTVDVRSATEFAFDADQIAHGTAINVAIV